MLLKVFSLQINANMNFGFASKSYEKQTAFLKWYKRVMHIKRVPKYQERRKRGKRRHFSVNGAVALKNFFLGFYLVPNFKINFEFFFTLCFQL